MNKARRELLRLAINSLNNAESYISTALDQEQDCLDNMPENLEGSERYEKMQNAADCLEEAIESIESARENIETAAE